MRVKIPLLALASLLVILCSILSSAKADPGWRGYAAAKARKYREGRWENGDKKCGINGQKITIFTYIIK